MPEEYTVSLRLTVTKATPPNAVVTEESSFASVSFAKMTHLSSEFYDLVAKLEKEKK